MALPRPSLSTPAEGWAPSDPIDCDPRERRGVNLFLRWVLRELGGGSLGTGRPCDTGPVPSDHWSNRAWDWKMAASSADDQAIVHALFDWLFDNDAEYFRRLGLKYIIWDHHIWRGGSGGWQDYTGPNPHIDHVHFSFGHAGADGKTSMYPWLDEQVGDLLPPCLQLNAPPCAKPPVASLKSGPPAIVPLTLAFAAGWAGMHYALPYMTKRGWW